MKSSNIKRNMGRLTNSACALLFAGTMFVSCKDELLTGMPSWLGSSIYEELQARGEYETTLRLINDPVFAQEGLPTILSQTGSKTLFVAKDEAYKRFFQSNPWGVHKYEDLSDAQKKLLLRTSLVNNAYLMELMTNTDASEVGAGQALRHETSLSLYDSVQVLKPEDMPNNPYWDKYRNKNMLVMRDATVPMVSHYLPAFMAKKQITGDDISFISNGAYSDNETSYVSGNKVIEQDVTCQNGYIHVLDNVLQPLTSMAEVIGNNPNYSVMKSFLDRFAFPELNESATREYNRIYNNGVAVDSVYTWRYLNNGFNAMRNNNTLTGDHNAVRVVNNDVETGDAWANILPYDPGWNQYYNTISGSNEDMAVFIVPTDDAFRRYENDGATGTTLMENYGGRWENVPNEIIAKLLQNLMKTSFIGTVPSKFHTVLNTAQQPFFNSQEDIDALTSCQLTSNGLIYEANKVFSAPEYVSVVFPVMLDDNMKVTYTAITDLLLTTYLNSMDSKYTFIAPTNDALKNYIDPVDYCKGKGKQTVTEFSLENNKIVCKRYKWEDGAKGEESSSSPADDAYITNRMMDIMNNSIIIGDVEDSLKMGYNVFTTKGGAPIVFKKNTAGENIELKGPGNDDFIPLRSDKKGYYNMTNSAGNGITCVVNEAPVMPAHKSVLEVLSDLVAKDAQGAEYEEFYNMLANSTLVSDRYDKGTTMSNGKTIISMNNYQYTVYVPSSEKIRELVDAGTLPDYKTIIDDIDEGGKVVKSVEDKLKEEFSEEWKDLIEAAEKEDEEKKDEEALAKLEEKIDSVVNARQAKINTFLRYHIQNSALYLGSNIRPIKYESTLMNPKTGRFYVLDVTPGAPGAPFSIKSAVSNAPVRHVISNENHFAREYRFKGAGGASLSNLDRAGTIYNSSFAVVHLIDGPLFYDESMMPGSDANAVNRRLRNNTKR